MSIHSTTLHNFMKRIDTSLSDQLRIEGMKIELCLLNLDSGLTRGSDGDNLNTTSTAYSPNQQQFTADGQFNVFQTMSY